jgi:hypothetical protein
MFPFARLAPSVVAIAVIAINDIIVFIIVIATIIVIIILGFIAGIIVISARLSSICVAANKTEQVACNLAVVPVLQLLGDVKSQKQT